MIKKLICPRSGLRAKGVFIAWKILILGLCSFDVKSATGEGSENDQMNRQNVVSYGNDSGFIRNQRYKQSRLTAAPPATKVENYSDSSDLSSSATTMYPQRQVPSVYHSIIDETNAQGQSAISPAIQTSTSTTGDLNVAAGHHHGHSHGNYYEYRAVPKKKTWKFGYKRGNHKHTISRHEHGKAGKHPHFKTKVKWHDIKSKGKGIHLWDYNHHDKKHYHHG